MHSLTISRTNLSTWARVLGVSLFAVLTLLSARAMVYLPFSPVPLTMQVLVVVLSGLMLGAWGGFVAQAIALQAILLGIGFSAGGLTGPAAFVSPTGGYLLAFPFAALVAGYLARRSGGSVTWGAIGSSAALGLIYLCGAAWLSVYLGDVQSALALGVAPFIAADAVKLVVANGLLALRRG